MCWLVLLDVDGVGPGVCDWENNPCRKLVSDRLMLAAGVEHIGRSASVSVAYWLAVIVVGPCGCIGPTEGGSVWGSRGS